MRAPFPALTGVLAAFSVVVGGCSADPVAPPATERAASGGVILTSFDQLTLARGEHSSFRASLVGSRARVSSAGLTFVSRASSVASVKAVNGRARVEGLSAGRTWILVRAAAATDSVEVVVE